MSDADGMDVLPAIRLVAPSSKVVVFSTSVGLGDNAETVILHGADAAFDKTINTKALLRRLIRLLEADPRATLVGAIVRVLVVDDQPEVRRVLRRFLEKKIGNVEILEASDG